MAGKGIVHHWPCYAVVIIDEIWGKKASNRIIAQPKRPNQWNVDFCAVGKWAGFSGPLVFFSKAFSLSGRQLQWTSRRVSSNSWEMKGACALEKPSSSKACVVVPREKGDVITEMSPLWRFTAGGRGYGVPQKERKNCVDKYSKTLSTRKWACWEKLEFSLHFGLLATEKMLFQWPVWVSVEYLWVYIGHFFGIEVAK